MWSHVLHLFWPKDVQGMDPSKIQQSYSFAKSSRLTCEFPNLLLEIFDVRKQEMAVGLAQTDQTVDILNWIRHLIKCERMTMWRTMAKDAIACEWKFSEARPARSSAHHWSGVWLHSSHFQEPAPTNSMNDTITNVTTCHNTSQHVTTWRNIFCNMLQH